jgi:hypothetical protein
MSLQTCSELLLRRDVRSPGDEIVHIDALASFESRAADSALKSIDDAADLAGRTKLASDAPEGVTGMHDHLDRR